MKKNKRFDEIFKNEFNKVYNSDITAKDIFEPGSLKPTKKKTYWKYSTIMLSLAVIIISVFIGINHLKINYYVEIDFEKVYFNENNNILTEEEILDIKSYCDYGFLVDQARYTKLDNNLSFYVYEGQKYYIDGNNHVIQNVYIYVFDIKDEDLNIVINIDGKDINASKEHRYGVLKVFEETDNQILEFSISYNNTTKKCKLNYE